MAYFKKHWPAGLRDDVVTCVEELVRVFYARCPIKNLHTV